MFTLTVSMHHPLFHILIAMLVGVCSPLCCCQMTAMAGGACGAFESAESVADDCCRSSESQRPSEDDPSRSGREGSGSRDCQSCPGASVDAGLTVDSRLPTLERRWNAIATIEVRVQFQLIEADGKSVLCDAPRRGRPPRVKSNRAVQRWHCALTM